MQDGHVTTTADSRTAGQSEAILSISDLHLSYHGESSETKILRGVTITVGPGELVGLVGESGSGKSTLARAALGLTPGTSARVSHGSITVCGRDVTGLRGSEWNSIRGNPLAMVFQDPLSYLNPVLRVGFQIAEAVRRHDPEIDAGARVLETLRLVQLPASVARSYPHQLSGGMRQRCLLALALACRPRLLIGDEPTTALDVTTQAEILELLMELQRKLKMALLLISHDLGVISQVCKRVYVMYAGEIMESGPTEAIFSNPQHPYTRALIQSARMPRFDEPFATVPGDVPSATQVSVGCPFAPRCELADERCHASKPPPTAPSLGHETRCWRAVERVEGREVGLT